MSLIVGKFIRDKSMFPTSQRKGVAVLLGESKQIDPRSAMSYETVRRLRNLEVGGNTDISNTSQTKINNMFMSG